jgi:hypothetical protein
MQLKFKCEEIEKEWYLIMAKSLWIFIYLINRKFYGKNALRFKWYKYLKYIIKFWNLKIKSNPYLLLFAILFK